MAFPRGLRPRPVVWARARCTAAAVNVASSASSDGWSDSWIAATSNVESDVGFDESANRLRALIQTGLLRFTDLRDNPERFFEAHRILARHAVEHGPGFWIRFTVQYNLFAGTVLAVGGDDQIAALDGMQTAGMLGCFGLTEKLAGVQSGLIVNTTCEWDEVRQRFVLDTPNEGARKNWISQGAVADKAVVLADLTVDGTRCGPHAFLMDFRDAGAVMDGIELADMGRKTTGNDLDNAWLAFDKVELPKSALLNKYADIVDGAYVQNVDGIRAFDMIGQRLYTGRVAVAQAALEYSKHLFKVTERYSDNKPCPSPAGEVMLSNIPQLQAIYAEAECKLAEIERFVGKCEVRLSECLRQSALPPKELIEAIATAKVRAVETSIDLCFRLKQEVGSFALMDDAGFKHMDFLQCCKFAEGDSRILMQKMARDRLKDFANTKGDGAVADLETRLCAEISSAMAKEIASSGDKQKAWDQSWQQVYALANAVMDRTLESEF